jgi:lysophospholipase L1-like esterase
MDVVALGIAKADAAKRYPPRLRALTRPQIAYPALSSETVTIGTAVSVGAATPAQTTGSIQTAPIAHPIFKGGVFANGFNTDRFTQLGWSLGNRFNNGWPSPGGYTGGGYPTGVEFLHYGSRFEIRLNAEASSSVFQIFIDDQPVASSALIATVSAGAATVLPVTFSGGTRLRRIRLEVTRQEALGAIIIAGTDMLAAAGKRTTPQGVVFGDSYADGANGVLALDTYAARLGKYLNADIWIDGQGGTGIVATGGGGTKDKYLGRITAAATDARLKPDFVILQGSTNDANGNEGTIPTAAPAAIAQVRSQWPAAKVVVTGLLYPRGSLGPGMATANTNMRAAALANADLFIDAQAEGWFTGNSTAAATNGSGNSDVFMSSDTVHGTAAFHDVVASMLARRTANYFASLG